LCGVGSAPPSMMGNVSCEDEASLEARDEFVAALGFWVEGAVLAAVSAAGLAGNAVAAPVLLSPRTAPSAFNRMLVFLSMFDAIFLACCASEAVRRHLYPGSELHLIAFARLLYPLQSAALMWSSYATVTLAAERYQAVCRPIEYHMATAASGPAGAWRRAIRYMVPVVILGRIINYYSPLYIVHFNVLITSSFHLQCYLH